MDKRYQVFVSSTYHDLEKERQEVMQALLELDCFPAGMELFPAADMAQWELIKKVIDDSDYYLLILGGRYGSEGPNGLSYTEMEYDYAVSIGKPTVSFFHEDPSRIEAGKSETTAAGKKKLKAFQKKVKGKICKGWSTPSGLGSVVSRSIIQLIKSSPAVGWVRANQLADGEAKSELLRQRGQIDALEKELDSLRVTAPIGAEGLAQGHENYTFQIRFEQRYSQFLDEWTPVQGTFSCTWNQMFSRVAPLLITSSTENEIKAAVDDFVSQGFSAGPGPVAFRNFQIDRDDFATILVQFRALGLIKPSNLLKSGLALWTLTPFGDEVMMQSRAIRREVDPPVKTAKTLSHSSKKKSKSP